MRGLLHTVVGFLLGIVVGALAVVVHAGPVDQPLIGVVLATVIVASGSWFLLESGWSRAWLGGVIGVAASALWLLMFPPANDSFVSVEQWPSQLWLILGPLSAIAPAWVRSTYGGNHE